MAKNKRFVYYEHKGADYILENPNTKLDFIEMLGDCLEAEEIVDKLNDLTDENNKLKERNKRQYNQLKELWDLIEGENWEILIEMVNKMKEEDKRLQKMGV